ncbi:ABC transporter substrate-binding protein [Labrys monachus]|uniref:Branched-chain amino acid transport system substrate-binding protein n=1 Tax=Labrys monachus TaxID=217067 RepID=A0ABU0FIP8_9HYPH|nr:ABC transporter substrate-binding protein [Labrys monachus]MDQ0394460.1 branched-chain amino acid transport system substrate-binding protein [Labrys monachus]
MIARKILGALALGVSIYGILVGAAQADIIKLGVLAPVTGKAASDGEDAVRGVKMAVDDLNKAGGIGGNTFEVVVGDVGEASSDAVATAAERLLGDRAMGAIFANYASGTNFEIEMMAEQDMIYMVSANSQQTKDIISPKPQDFGTVWSLTPSYDGYNTEIVPVIDSLVAAGKLKLPNKKVAMIASDNPYSKGIAEGMVKAFKAAGWQITQDDLLPFGEINDWRSFLAKVRQDPPALLINTDYVSSNAATFMTQFMENPTDSLVFIQYAPSVPEFLKLTKEKSSGIVYNMLGGMLPPASNPRADELVKKYEGTYHNEPGSAAVMLYEQVMIYADALRKVGDATKHDDIGAAIAKTDKMTAVGRVAFDPATHLTVQDNEHVPIQFYQIQDGKRVMFYPPQYRTGDFAQPSWMK